MSVITTRRADQCRRCGRAVHVGEKVDWSPRSGVRCLEFCGAGVAALRAAGRTADAVVTTGEAPAPAAPDLGARTPASSVTGWPAPGVPGASALREYETRAAGEKVARTRSWPRRLPAGFALVLLSLPATVMFNPAALAFGVLVGAAVVVLPIWGSPTSGTVHYRTGAVGEREVGRRLQDLVERQLALGRGAAVLHDRALPGRSENADHVVVTSAGVTVVETKNWSGRLRVHQGSYYAGVSSVDKAAAQAKRQAAAVRRALVAEGMRDVPVHAVVCLVGQARPRVALQVKGVTVCGADQLWVALPTGDLGTRQQVADVAWALDRHLRAA